MKFTKSLMLTLLIVSASANLFAQKKADPLGTWRFYAQDAPYEYNSGDIVIGKASYSEGTISFEAKRKKEEKQ